MIADGIERRPANRGLLNRGIVELTADDLRRLVHEEHRSYREIGAMFGVDPSAVQHWLKRHDIDPPTAWGTRYKGSAPAIPEAIELARLYADGLSLDEIGQGFGVSGATIRLRLAAAGFEIRRDGYDGGKRFACADGHSVRSTYEQRVCNWLAEQSIPHSYEPPLPWDRRSRADFLANGWYVEVWGVQDSPSYAERRARKQAGYRAHGAAVVEINHFDFSKQKRGRWKRLLMVTSRPPEHALPLL